MNAQKTELSGAASFLPLLRCGTGSSRVIRHHELINLYLDEVRKAVAEHWTTSVKLSANECFVLRYAGNITAMSTNENHSQELWTALQFFSKRNHLVIDDYRYYTMCVSKKTRGPRYSNVTIKLEGHTLQQIKEFWYLGFTMNETLSLSKSAAHLAKSALRNLHAFIQENENLPPGHTYRTAKNCSKLR